MGENGEEAGLAIQEIQVAGPAVQAIRVEQLGVVRGHTDHECENRL